ncbi:MAG: hypothetical protein AAGA18_02065 [Verrucomicrobiota bacterium]
MKKSIIMLAIVVIVISLSFIASFGLTTYMLVNTLIPELAVLPPLPEPKEMDILEKEEEVITFESLHEPSIDNINHLARELKHWQDDLQKKQFELLEMDQVLLERENLLAAEREALERQMGKLIGLKEELESLVIHVETNEQENYKNLAKLYSTMRMDQSMKMMRQLPDDQVLQMLTIMKMQTTAKMLEVWLKEYPDDLPRLTRITDDMRRMVKASELETPGGAQ